MTYKIFGREVIGYRMKEAPDIICIDVMQKEGDCILGLTPNERLNCPMDCGNTFVMVNYHDVNKEIVQESALLVNTATYLQKELDKHGLEYENIKELVTKEPENFSLVPSETIFSKDLLYKGNLIGHIYVCQFMGGEGLIEGRPGTQECLQYIRDNIEEIIVLPI